MPCHKGTQASEPEAAPRKKNMKFVGSVYPFQDPTGKMEDAEHTLMVHGAPTNRVRLRTLGGDEVLSW